MKSLFPLPFLFLIGGLTFLKKRITTTIQGIMAVFFAAIVILFSVFKLLKTRAIEDQKMLDLANEMAMKDSMTGVKNKHAYTIKETLINESIGKGEIKPFAIVACDVNDLKYVNDNFVHEHGDKFIKDACKPSARPSPILQSSESVAMNSSRFLRGKITRKEKN